MTTTQEKTGSGKCPVTFALDIIGDRWTLLILRDMIFRGKSHYGEFAKSAEKISTNILADRLARLEAAGLVTKSPDPDYKTKFIYGMTPKASDLIPVILDLIAWSAKYDPQPPGQTRIIHGGPDNLLHRILHDRVALIAELETNIARTDNR